jgi:hypothetical protein
MLGGATTYPIPGKSEVEQRDAAPELKDPVETGDVTQGKPRQRKWKGTLAGRRVAFTSLAAVRPS